MMYIDNMNLQQRIDRFLQRGFQQADAEILVLLEESASSLFSAFPNRFILFGGATLVLFYESPRLSRDLDLLPSAEDLPPIEQVQQTVETNLQPFADALGLGTLECKSDGKDKDFLKLYVCSNQRPLFTIDLTRIGGTVLKSEIVHHEIAGNANKIVDTPSANYLLLQKCETFLTRQNIKTRDAFDIDLLLQKGARLDQNLSAHLEDFIQMRELDSESIRSRIDKVHTKLCTVELRPVLPDFVFQTFAKEDFRRLRESVATVLAAWL